MNRLPPHDPFALGRALVSANPAYSTEKPNHLHVPMTFLNTVPIGKFMIQTSKILSYCQHNKNRCKDTYTVKLFKIKHGLQDKPHCVPDKY